MPKPKPRNAGTMTEAQFWGKVRAVLRNGFRYWKPIQQCKQAARREYKGPNKRLKWEYQCNLCKNWFPDKEVQVDHIDPCGSLKGEEDLVLFLRKLTVEVGYQVLCKPCHVIKTKEERDGRVEKPNNG